MKNNIDRINDNPQSDMYNGIKKVRNVIKTTLGPYGRNVAIMRQSLSSMPLVTDDGVRVAEFCIESLENYELLGAKLVYEASKRTEEEIGDGTTTSYVLASNMIEEYMKLVESTNNSRELVLNPVLLRRSLENISKLLVKAVDKYKIKVTDTEVLRHIANVSAGREDIGNLVGDVRQKIGLDGLITIKFSRDGKESVKYSKGYEINGGFDQVKFYNDTNNAEFDDPFVVIINRAIMTKEDVDKIIEGYGQLCKYHNRPLYETPMIVLCRNFDGDAKKIITHNWYFRSDGKILPIIPIEVPIDYDPKGTMEDLASICNGKVIDETAQLTKELVVSSTGSVTTVISNKKSTVLISSNNESIQSRIDYLSNVKSSLIEKSDSSEINNLEVRIAKLKGEAATIYVGGKTPTECNERKLKFDDAILSTRSAIKDGVISGGGIAQLLASKELSDMSSKYDDYHDVMAISIIREALNNTVKQLIENSGFLSDSFDSIVEDLSKLSNTSIMNFEPLDIIYNEDINLIKVYDPYKVLVSSIENSISVVSQFITIDTAVVLSVNSQ